MSICPWSTAAHRGVSVRLPRLTSMTHVAIVAFCEVVVKHRLVRERHLVSTDCAGGNERGSCSENAMLWDNGRYAILLYSVI